MNLSRAYKIAKTAGVKTWFDRDSKAWIVGFGKEPIRRFSSGEFGKLSEADFEVICKAPAMARLN